MATATFKFVPNTVLAAADSSQRSASYYGTITFSAAGDTYATGGLLPATGFALANLGPYADRAPLVIQINSAAGSGWNYEWIQSTGKLKILSGNSSGSGTTAPPELTNATALNAATPNIFTDVVQFEVIFPRV